MQQISIDTDELVAAALALKETTRVQRVKAKRPKLMPWGRTVSSEGEK